MWFSHIKATFKNLHRKSNLKILGAKGVLLCLTGNAGSPCKGIKISQSHNATKNLYICYLYIVKSQQQITTGLKYSCKNAPFVNLYKQFITTHKCTLHTYKQTLDWINLHSNGKFHFRLSASLPENSLYRRKLIFKLADCWNRFANVHSLN